MGEKPNLFKAHFSKLSNLVIKENMAEIRKEIRKERGKKEQESRPYPVLGCIIYTEEIEHEYLSNCQKN